VASSVAWVNTSTRPRQASVQYSFFTNHPTIRPLLSVQICRTVSTLVIYVALSARQSYMSHCQHVTVIYVALSARVINVALSTCQSYICRTVSTSQSYMSHCQHAKSYMSHCQHVTVIYVALSARKIIYVALSARKIIYVALSTCQSYICRTVNMSVIYMLHCQTPSFPNITDMCLKCLSNNIYK
jgi:hypothetical protein